MCMPPNNYNNGCGGNNWGNNWGKNINPADLNGDGNVNPFEQLLHDMFGFSNPNANQGQGNHHHHHGHHHHHHHHGASPQQAHNNIGKYERWWDFNGTLQKSEAKKLINDEFHNTANGGPDNNYVGNNNNIIGDTWAERQLLSNKYGIQVGPNGVSEDQLNQMLRDKYNNY